MSHLKKSASGHLLKNSIGHLVKTCAASPSPSPSPSGSPSGSPSPSPGPTLVVSGAGETGVDDIYTDSGVGSWLASSGNFTLTVGAFGYIETYPISGGILYRNDTITGGDPTTGTWYEVGGASPPPTVTLL